MVYFQKLKMGIHAVARLCNLSSSDDRVLGFIGWKVTVISSNFIALMLILNMAMNIHLTVRYLQLKKEFPQFTISETAIFESSKKMMLPILYTGFNHYMCVLIFGI